MYANLYIKTENFAWPKPCIVPEAHQVYKCSGLHHTWWYETQASCDVDTHVIVHII